MKLIYRGATYDYNPEPSRAHVSQEPYKLIYRGHTYEVDPSVRSAEPPMPAESNLIYRGVAYQVHRDAHGKTVTAHPVSKVQSESVPAVMPRRFLGKIHQANLMENLQRRLRIAQEKGDEQLIRLLEAERRQLNP